jgi:uncharacterized protein YbjT (DUF2867 family)
MEERQVKILVTGGTGLVGSHVVRELLARDQEVYVLTRDAKKVAGLPNRVRGVVGDLGEVETIQTVFGGMDAVFLLNVVSPKETHEGIMGVHGATVGKAKRLVYLSVQSASEAALLPHFGAKAAVELAVQQSGIPYTLLRPNNYFQNDRFVQAALVEHGIYPQPIGGTGISRVDVRDIAELAAMALTTSAHEGKTYDLVGPRPLTGKDCAEIWGRALGRKVEYGGDDLDAWEQQSLQYMPDWLVFDFKHMYAWFQANGWKGTDKDVSTLTSILGHPPRDLESYAREMAAAWKA